MMKVEHNSTEGGMYYIDQFNIKIICVLSPNINVDVNKMWIIPFLIDISPPWEGGDGQ